MTLVRFNPARGLCRADHRFHRHFASDMPLREKVSHIVPRLNAEKTENEFNISVELPGMNKEDIQITFQDNILNISGEKKRDDESDDKNNYHSERYFGKFSRSIGINSGVKLDDISADYKNGVLNISIPKAEEAKPKKIDVKIK